MIDFSPLLNCEYYLSLFNEESFPGAFKQYTRECSMLFTMLIYGEDPTLLAGALIREISARLDSFILPWKRRNAETSYRSMLALYLSPAALENGNEVCAEFADVLARQWQNKFGSAYELGTYAELIEGFKPTHLLGFRLDG